MSRAASSIRTTLSVLVEHEAWRGLVADPAPLLRCAAKTALAAARSDRRKIGTATLAIAVALIDDRTMRRLNRTYRGKDKATNVLSFPAAETARGGKRRNLGDIAIAFGTLRREAREQGKAPLDHLAHLMVHAVFHLLGYDHESDAEADRMEALERKALAAIGIGDPYAWRA